MTAPSDTFELKPVRDLRPWEAFSFKVEEFPLGENQRDALRAFVTRLVGSLTSQQPLTPATWIEMSQIHHDGGSRVLAANARLWKPSLGLGIYPDREPPRLWTKNDFLDRAWDEPLPDFMLTVSHVTDTKSTQHARDTMIGRGVVTHLLLEKSVDAFHAKAKAFFLPRIREEAFRCYPLYLPLLGKSSLEQADPQTLFQWLDGVAVYIRECFDDKEMLLLSRIPMELHFKAMGMKRTSVAEVSSWSYTWNTPAPGPQAKII